MGFGTWLPDPNQWIIQMYRLVIDLGLNTTVESLGWALAVSLFAYGFVRALYYGRGGEFPILIGRLILAMVVLLALPAFRGLMHDTWVSVYQWSTQVWDPGLGAGLSMAERLRDASEGMSENLGSFLASVEIMEAGGWDADDSGVVSDTMSNLLTARGWFSDANIILHLLLPLLFSIYAALIFASGMVVLIGNVVLPIAGAILLLPGGGQAWFSQWVRMYAGALFTVAFLPIMFGLIVEVGFVQPVEQINGTIEDALIEVNALAVEVEDMGSGQDWWRTGNLLHAWDMMSESWDAVRSTSQVIRGYFTGMMRSLIMLLVGFIVTIFLMLRLERYVHGFMGGVGASVGLGGAKLAMMASTKLAALSAARSAASVANSKALASGSGGGQGGSGGPGKSPPPLPPPKYGDGSRETILASPNADDWGISSTSLPDDPDDKEGT